MAFNPHPQLAPELIRGKSYRNANRFLREFGATKSERRIVIKMAKEKGLIDEGEKK